MSNKLSYIDAQRLARDFRVGDTVLLPIYTRGNRYAPSLGVVTAVLDKIGFIDVETPFGNIRMSPENLVKEPNSDASYLEDTSLDTWERGQSKKLASRYSKDRLIPATMKAFELREEGLSEIEAYLRLSEANSHTHGDGEIKNAVSLAYDPGLMSKVAIYWKAKGRRYMPSKAEIESGCFNCPHCRAELQKTHYKKHTKLYVCPECLFTIRPKDMLEPGAEIEPLEDEFVEKSPIDFFTPNDPLLRSFRGDK